MKRITAKIILDDGFRDKNWTGASRYYDIDLPGKADSLSVRCQAAFMLTVPFAYWYRMSSTCPWYSKSSPWAPRIISNRYKVSISYSNFIRNSKFASLCFHKRSLPSVTPLTLVFRCSTGSDFVLRFLVQGITHGWAVERNRAFPR